MNTSARPRKKSSLRSRPTGGGESDLATEVVMTGYESGRRGALGRDTRRNCAPRAPPWQGMGIAKRAAKTNGAAGFCSAADWQILRRAAKVQRAFEGYPGAGLLCPSQFQI